MRLLFNSQKYGGRGQTIRSLWVLYSDVNTMVTRQAEGAGSCGNNDK